MGGWLDGIETDAAAFERQQWIAGYKYSTMFQMLMLQPIKTNH